MTTTVTDALTERIARVLHEIDPVSEHGHDWGKLSNSERRFYRHKAAAVLPIVAEEVRRAKAEAWQEGVNFALPGKETYWISKHNPHRATETGDSDEHL